MSGRVDSTSRTRCGFRPMPARRGKPATPPGPPAAAKAGRPAWRLGVVSGMAAGDRGGRAAGSAHLGGLEFLELAETGARGLGDGLHATALGHQRPGVGLVVDLGRARAGGAGAGSTIVLALEDR